MDVKGKKVKLSIWVSPSSTSYIRLTFMNVEHVSDSIMPG